MEKVKDQLGFGVLIWEHIWTIWRDIWMYETTETA